MNKLRTKFRKWQKNHPNPFTSKILNLEKANNNIIELSRDPRREFYGVAVWQKLNENCETCNEDREQHWRFESTSHDLSKSFHDREEAREYQAMLKQKFKDYNEIKEIVEKVERQVEDF